MNICIGCKHAQWKKTAAGRLHPSQEGRCSIPTTEIKIPAAYYWLNGVPLYGGRISRKSETMKDCFFFEPEET